MSPVRPFPFASESVAAPGACPGVTHSISIVSPIPNVEAEIGPTVPTWHTENWRAASIEAPA